MTPSTARHRAAREVTAPRADMAAWPPCLPREVSLLAHESSRVAAIGCHRPPIAYDEELQLTPCSPQASLLEEVGAVSYDPRDNQAHRRAHPARAASSGDVGVTGYTLGGGVSWLARSHGLAANHVRAFEVVTAYGEPRRVDEEHDPDLFWALRGGGGSFAVVTAIEFALFPISEVYAGALFFPLERAREVFNAWARWTDTAPAEITPIGRLSGSPR